MTPEARTVALDPRSAQRLNDAGLRYRTVDLSVEPEGTLFLRAVARGFLEPEPEAVENEQMRAAFVVRRNVGVFDPAEMSGLPVGTLNSWVTPLTVPGGEVSMWAISAVTVAGTHRRRGIARDLLEGELRAAASAGLPVAGLTVSEATIYGRYGFASAVPTARLVVDPRRAGWAGVVAPGRVEYLEREDLAAALGEVHDRERRGRAGQIAGWPGRWQRMAGLTAGDRQAASVRGVRYVDADGSVRGAMAYTLTEDAASFRSELTIRHLAAETDEALAALWGFALNHDLVTRVTASLRPVDDPLPLLVVDQRAVEVCVHDHGWLRILDVPAALSARSYRAPLDLTLQVEDGLGIAHGTWRLRVAADGTAAVEAAEGAPDAVMDVAVLSAMYVGGVGATRLRAAGRLDASAEIAARLDDAFHADRAPQLGIWY